jgi:hypothetical protein
MRGGSKYSATSDVFMSQVNAADINELVNMLTSEQQMVGGSNVTSELIPDTIILSATSQYSDRMIGGGDTEATSEYNKDELIGASYSATSPMVGGGKNANETDTEQLENQLRNLLRGGAKKSSKKSSRKGSKKHSRRGSRKGSKKASKKTSKKRSRKTSKKSSKKGGSIVGGGKKKSSKKTSRKTSKKSSKKASKKGGSIVGGGKKKSSKKTSKKSSRKASKKSSKKGGSIVGGAKKSSRKSSRKSSKGKGGGGNPGFMAFQKLKKHVAEALKIPNSVQAAKIGGAALKKVKAAHPDIDSIKASAEAIKEFDNNIEKYRKML